MKKQTYQVLDETAILRSEPDGSTVVEIRYYVSIREKCFRRYFSEYLNFGDKSRLTENNYKHELTNLQHHKLIQTLLSVPGHKIVSGYESELYQPLLDAGWTIKSKKSMHSVGHKKVVQRTECLYCSPVTD